MTEDVDAAALARLDSEFEQLADALRDFIAALEEEPSLGPAEARLLVNLRGTLADWLAG